MPSWVALLTSCLALLEKNISIKKKDNIPKSMGTRQLKHTIKIAEGSKERMKKEWKFKRKGNEKNESLECEAQKGVQHQRKYTHGQDVKTNYQTKNF